MEKGGRYEAMGSISKVNVKGDAVTVCQVETKLSLVI